MTEFFRTILHWIDSFFTGLSSIIAGIFEEDGAEEKRGVEPGAGEAEKPILKPGELVMGSRDTPEYRKSKSVLTYRESVLHNAIRDATNGEYAILMKVRMGDFVWLRNEPSDRKFFNNQVLCKHVDFLLCDKDTLGPLLVIELDDSSHKGPGSAERDRFKDETFGAIGMPYIRVPLQATYDVDALKKEIRERIGVPVG